MINENLEWDELLCKQFINGNGYVDESGEPIVFIEEMGEISFRPTLERVIGYIEIMKKEEDAFFEGLEEF